MSNDSNADGTEGMSPVQSQPLQLRWSPPRSRRPTARSGRRCTASRSARSPASRCGRRSCPLPSVRRAAWSTYSRRAVASWRTCFERTKCISALPFRASGPAAQTSSGTCRTTWTRVACPCCWVLKVTSSSQECGAVLKRHSFLSQSWDNYRLAGGLAWPRRFCADRGGPRAVPGPSDIGARRYAMASATPAHALDRSKVSTFRGLSVVLNRCRPAVGATALLWAAVPQYRRPGVHAGL